MVKDSDTAPEAPETEASTEAAAGPGSETIEAPPASSGVQSLVIPDLGDFEEVEVIEIHVGAGSKVDIDDPLVTLETGCAGLPASQPRHPWSRDCSRCPRKSLQLPQEAAMMP